MNLKIVCQKSDAASHFDEKIYHFDETASLQLEQISQDELVDPGKLSAAADPHNRPI